MVPENQLESVAIAENLVVAEFFVLPLKKDNTLEVWTLPMGY